MIQTALANSASAAAPLPPAHWQESFGLGMIAALCVGLTIILLAMVLARGLLSLRKKQRQVQSDRDIGGFLDLPFLDKLAHSTPPQRMGPLLHAMIRDCRNRIQDIRAAAREGDLDRVQSESSALAHACDAFGATGLAANARALFYAVRDQAFDEAGKKIIELETIAHTTFEALSDRAGQDGTAGLYIDGTKVKN